MDDQRKAVILDITKGVMVLTVDLTQAHGKLLAYGALEWAKENVEGWFLQQEMLRQKMPLIKPGIILPHKNGGDAA